MYTHLFRCMLIWFTGLLILFTASPLHADAPSVRYRDASDHTTVITGPLRRVIPLYSAFSEILLALHAEDCICARTANEKDPRLQDLPGIGTHMRPNPEQIVALRPDLVLQLHGRQDATTASEALRNLGVPVLELRLESFADLFSCIQLLGQLTAHEEDARSLETSLRDRLRAIRMRHDPARKIRVLFEVRSPNLLAAGTRNIIHEIIDTAGGENVVTDTRKLVRLTDEAVLRLDPDAYVIQKGPMNPDPLPLDRRPTLRSLQAARTKRFLIVDEALFSRPSPGSVEACDLLERWLHSPVPHTQAQ